MIFNARLVVTCKKKLQTYLQPALFAERLWQGYGQQTQYTLRALGSTKQEAKC